MGEDDLKVPWSDEPTLRYEDLYESDVFHEMPNTARNEREFWEWKEFREGNYYDGTPPPDFVTKVILCWHCEKNHVQESGASCQTCIEKEDTEGEN